MAKITFVEADGTEIVADAQPGQTLMQVAVAAGVTGIVAECGGVCACATCHCYLASKGVVPEPQEPETDMLDFVIDPQPTSRLSCQIEITDELDNLTVHVPESQT